MSSTDLTPSFDLLIAFSQHHRSQCQRHTTNFILQSLHFPKTAYQYPIIMVSASPESAKPKSTQSPITSTTAAAAAVEQLACWTDEHETELKRLAARGEDAKSIIELLGTDYPCLNGKLSEQWIKQKVKAVDVTG
jgi:hypothetical protein